MTERSNQLVASYRASAEVEALVTALGGDAPVLGGLCGASLAFALAAWKDPRSTRADGPTLILTASQEEAEELEEELSTFSDVPVSSFPAWESLFLPDSVPDGDIYRQRVALVESLAAPSTAAEPRFIVAPIQAAIQPVPPRGRLEASRWVLRVEDERSPLALAEDLIESGFRRVPLVQARGEVSSRGDILDIFPFEAERPFRVEFFGDAIESIREFDPDTQRSTADPGRKQLEILRLSKDEVHLDCFRGAESVILDLLGPHGKVIVREPPVVLEKAKKIFRNILGEAAETVFPTFWSKVEQLRPAQANVLPIPSGEPGLNLKFLTVERYRSGDVSQVLAHISERLAQGQRFEIYCENQGELQRFEEILADHGLALGSEARGQLLTVCGGLRRGFEIEALHATLLTTREIFHRHVLRRPRRRSVPSRAIQSFLELEKGDHVVHLVHGIGRFLGMECFERNGIAQEFLSLEFRDGVKVYVPVSKIELVQKYVGSGDKAPILDKVGGVSWSRKKEEVETALLDMASDLLEVQALRRERPGFAFSGDNEWQREFEAGFPFEETPDQTEILAAIKTDMEAPRPMDRLICGDVGYGKTELAVRAAFKAVQSGKQVAVLVPTTVLAQQHFRTFGERMAEFPVNINVISRFRSPAEQKEIARSAAEGKLDILIGTHRLLSNDVAFRDLGLVVIDEEQRFGVAHKEKLKLVRSTVDVLTLTATPIPRTLHLSLLGIRDISSLTTAPEGRVPVRTEVCRFEPRRVREIILRELNRDGQIYYVHNRIHDIDSVVRALQKAVPEARIEHAHGQMNEQDLEDRMIRFYEREFDILVCTTIIESGLDIPSVNTIFIDEADHYGLADLHQLRGRVGRGKHQAYCYLLLPERRHLNPDAQKRVQALVEFCELGAGFQIALRDLEIRGAGNILGAAQSGHIAAVGYDMYCRLLEKAVRRLRNEPESEPVQVEIDLALDAHIPDDYIAQQPMKLELYRRISAATSPEEVTELAREIEDRFGSLPRSVENLIDVQTLRVHCARLGVDSVSRDDRNLILRGQDTMRQFLATCPRRVVILDPKTAAVSLVDPQRRYPPPLTDADAFQMALEWLSTGKFPEEDPGRRPRRADASGIRSGRG